MAFQPLVTQPTPDPFFIRELRKIDPDLRLSWGFERYLKKRWVVERRIPIDRYFAMHRSLFESDMPRFVDQPIIDDDQAVYDENGTLVSEKVIGFRHFDLAPEYEYLMTIETAAGDFRPFAFADILELKRMYAWAFNRPDLRREYEEKERVQRELAISAKQREDDLFVVDAFDQARREAGVKVQTGPGRGNQA